MRIHKDTPFVIGTRLWSISPPNQTLSIIVKGTFTLVDGQPSTISEEQEPCTEGLFHDDDPEQSVRYASDYAVTKARAEAYLMGSCHSSTGHYRL